MTVTGALHHIELNVSDLERSAAFWGGLLERLGYRLHQDWDGGKSWIKDKTYIVLVQTAQDHLDPPYHRCRVGLNHLAFHAGSRGEVDEITAWLWDCGVSILYEDRHPYAGGPQHYAVFFEDPDRIKMEIVAP